MKNNIKPDPLVRLSIKTYKVPIELKDGVIIESTMDLTPDMVVDQEDIVLDKRKDNITFKIKEYTSEVSKANESSKRLAINFNKDFIKKKILTKTN